MPTPELNRNLAPAELALLRRVYAAETPTRVGCIRSAEIPPELQPGLVGSGFVKRWYDLSDPQNSSLYITLVGKAYIESLAAKERSAA